MPTPARAIVVNSSTETDFFVCTLREAIKFHNAAGCYNPPPFGTCKNQPNSDTIDFAPNITNVFLDSPLPAITPPTCGGSDTLTIFPTLNRVTLHGAYFEIDAGAGLIMYNVNSTYGALDFQKDISQFFVNGGTLKIRIGDFSNNRGSPPDIGGIVYNKGGFVTIGGAKSTGDINLHDSSATSAGGAIYNDGGTLTVGNAKPAYKTTFTENSAPDGGAIYSNGGTVTI